MKIEVYSDGSATTKEKPGGWAYVICADGKKIAECAGHMTGATNNDAEMMAAIEGLYAVVKMSKDNAEMVIEEVTLVSDSQLILGWTDGTYRFKQQDKHKISAFNKLRILANRLKVKTRWVRGHSGDEHNERCDKLANEARLGVSKKIKQEQAKITGETLIGTKKSGTICVWYKGVLKIIDLETNIVENYKREIHGSRGSMLEVKEEKSR